MSRRCQHAHCNRQADQFVRFTAGGRGSYCQEHTDLVEQAYQVESCRPLTSVERQSPLKDKEFAA